ncbi:hypothetical protein Kpol_479p31 [Vanderwaltozyma polyspora DSM 70294]|uniref:FAD synthase n=1 Tax=Vanderwaltozyma polyspora (strain ATCC 22028 / DSM 70294 / BCRC 21397 / CBS 2163 / NBRC 10782 / NRRL Y-8283 / UCD 57-17) TaxID=436907 RepID=A7TQE4_VANPO|nr:uncharacterized protein Kpol_479p31 [Vanderwaltozyma polyspora DSM 70294]EDO15543.1 hypothetical protein Kpol_479p31 [Vanderwaltozyma polyspora DSM 70294]
MDLGHLAQLCYNMTESYLQITNGTDVINGTQEAIRITKDQLLLDIFKKWNPFNDALSFSFNGGKDCQVLLLLYLSCLWEFFMLGVSSSQFDRKYHKFPLTKLPSVLISQEEVFSTVDSYIAESIDRYNLDLYESTPQNGNHIDMAQAFENYLNLYPSTKAIVIGVRYTDPFGEHFKPLQPTDSNWPYFLRVQPILHWKLENIWSYLLFSGEPICGMYAKGFTSIGDIDNTLPNPYLIINSTNVKPQFLFSKEVERSFYQDKNATNEINITPLQPIDIKLIDSFEDDYYPGWFLVDDAKERAGRIKKQKKSTKA